MEKRKLIGRLLDVRVTAAALLVPGLALAAATMPRPAHAAEEDWKECVDEATADYNSCLVNAVGRWDRWLCDVNWELEVALCTAEAIGKIRDAANGSG